MSKKAAMLLTALNQSAVSREVFTITLGSEQDFCWITDILAIKLLQIRVISVSSIYPEVGTSWEATYNFMYSRYANY